MQGWYHFVRISHSTSNYGTNIIYISYTRIKLNGPAVQDHLKLAWAPENIQTVAQLTSEFWIFHVQSNSWAQRFLAGLLKLLFKDIQLAVKFCPWFLKTVVEQFDWTILKGVYGPFWCRILHPLGIHAYFHMDIHISIWLFGWTIFEGVIAVSDF